MFHLGSLGSRGEEGEKASQEPLALCPPARGTPHVQLARAAEEEGAGQQGVTGWGDLCRLKEASLLEDKSPGR